MNQDTMVQSIDDMIDTWSAQKELIWKLRNIKKMQIQPFQMNTSKFDLAFHDNYIQFLDEATKSILALRTKITNNNK